MEDPFKLELTNRFGSIYWAYNIPLQMWSKHEDPEDEKSKIIGWRVLNYMPRKEMCCNLDEIITPEEMPAYCRNAAKLLRNLADRFDKMSEGKINIIYYHDEFEGPPNNQT